MDVALLTFDGVDEIDLVGPFEVFSRARAFVPGLVVRIVSVRGQTDVVGGFGLRHQADGPLGTTPDLLVVPGGGWISREPRGVRAEIEAGPLTALIADAHAKGAVVAAVCTGALALAAAGVLANRPATTHRGAIGDLRATGARIVDAHVVDDGDVVTCGGVTHGIDLALWLVERFFGAEIAQRIGTGLEYTRTTSIWASAAAIASQPPPP